MPAIRYTTAPQRLDVVSHYVDAQADHKIWLKGSGNQFIAAKLAGFICVAGSNYLAGAKIGRVLVRDISNGDGGDTSEWRAVESNEYVYAMVLPGQDTPICQIVIGHDGWPITTLDEFRSFAKCPPSKR